MSFQPPPPPGGNFRPPPPPGGGGFAPPPPGGPRPGSGFAPPPPGGRPGGGFAPPPPQAGMNQLNKDMGKMSFAPPPPGGAGPPAGGPPPPGAPGQFGPAGVQPPPPGPFAGQSRGPPAGPPQQPAAPGMYQQPSAPGMFNPGAAKPGPPPPGPGAPPPPGGGYQQQAPAPPGAAPMGANPQAAQQYMDKIDYSITIPERLCRFTASKIPQNPAMATSSKIPLGGILRPLAPCGDDDEEVDTVQPGSAGIIRCKRCRTYINAFVGWLEHGRRWRCNICGQQNDTPAAYFCHLDDEGLRRDRLERPELSKGVVEFLAPAEYMVRPPQEPSYFFVLDVSATAVRSGMLHAAANAIKKSLDDLPGNNRTKIGFITFDNSVHYYNLGSDLKQPQMMVVSDLKELFVPLPSNLLVNLEESRDVVETFLDNLPDMFAKNPVVSQSCLGPALKAAFTVMKQVGGKMCVFQTIMPNMGDGSLKPRENQSIMGTPSEVKVLRPETPWYKDTAIEFSRQQISVDMFLFPYQYMDLSAMGELPKMTAGNMYSYVMFNFDKDAERFEEQLNKSLTTETAFEAVMRIRCTKGMRITNFYGNFYIRGTDLMALPNVNSESVFGFDLSHDEQNVASSYVTVQAALLYTSSQGQRRIRVMTQALPITGLTSELVESVDAQATCNLLCKQAVDVSLKTNIDQARMRLQQTCLDIMRSAKGGNTRTVSGYTVPQGPQDDGEEKPIPANLELIPLYTLAMMKNVAFRGGTDVHPDERIQAFHNIYSMWTNVSKYYIYPRLFSLHNMSADAGHPCDDGDASDESISGRNNTLLPDTLPLSVENLSSDGIYLLDNGVEMYIWVGRSADQNLVDSLFGSPTLDNVDPTTLQVDMDGDEFSRRVGDIIYALRDDLADPYHVSSRIQIVREGDGHMEARFFWFMVEDPASFQGGTFSYEDFMHFVQQGGNAPAPPGGARGMPPGGMPPGGMPPAQGRPGPPGPSGMAPPAPQQNYAPPPAQNQQYGGPPSAAQPPNYGGPPPPNNSMAPPPGGPRYGGPPAPSMAPPPMASAAPPPRQMGPPAYSAPASAPPMGSRPPSGPPGPPSGGHYRGPPPPKAAPPRGPPGPPRAPPGPPRGAPPPPGGARRGPPPPPPPPPGRRR